MRKRQIVLFFVLFPFLAGCATGLFARVDSTAIIENATARAGRTTQTVAAFLDHQTASIQGNIRSGGGQPTFIPPAPPINPTSFIITSTPIPTLPPTIVPTIPTIGPRPTDTPLPHPQTIWKAGFETRDLSEFNLHGGFVAHGSGRYEIVTPMAHSGSYSASLIIDTTQQSNVGSHASYLFFWDQNMLVDDAYYYSAWYYIPEGTIPHDWWNIWQWKSTFDGNSDRSVPMFDLDGKRDENGIRLVLYFRPDDDTQKLTWEQRNVYVQPNTWFQIEAFYKRAVDNSGQVIVWQDGTEIFNVAGKPTVMNDRTIYWSVNNYTDVIEPNPNRIFVDDMAITKTRLGPNQLP